MNSNKLRNNKIPLFENRPNQRLSNNDGQPIWHSRSCAVVGEVFLYSRHHQEWFVLLNQRGKYTPDYQGLWGFPCGYLDWNETLYQAMLREVWEECGIYLPILIENKCCDCGEQLRITKDLKEPSPWKISDDPDSSRQNLSFHFGVFIEWSSASFPAISTDHIDKGEVSDICWIPLIKARNMNLAFHHHDRLNELVDTHKQRFQKIENASIR